MFGDVSRANVDSDDVDWIATFQPWSRGGIFLVNWRIKYGEKLLVYSCPFELNGWLDRLWLSICMVWRVWQGVYGIVGYGWCGWCGRCGWYGWYGWLICVCTDICTDICMHRCGLGWIGVDWYKIRWPRWLAECALVWILVVSYGSNMVGRGVAVLYGP